MNRTISCRFMYLFCSLFTLLRVFGNCLAKQSKIRGSAHGQIRYSSIKRRTRHLKKIPKGLDPLEQAAIFSSDCLLWLEESTSQNEMINQNDYASFLLQFCLSSDFTGSRCIDTGDQLDFIALPKDIQLDFVTGLCPHDPVGKESCLNFLVSQEEQFGYSEFEGSYLCSTTYDLLIKNGLIDPTLSDQINNTNLDQAPSVNEYTSNAPTNDPAVWESSFPTLSPSLSHKITSSNAKSSSMPTRAPTLSSTPSPTLSTAQGSQLRYQPIPGTPVPQYNESTSLKTTLSITASVTLGLVLLTLAFMHRRKKSVRITSQKLNSVFTDDVSIISTSSNIMGHMDEDTKQQKQKKSYFGAVRKKSQHSASDIAKFGIEHVHKTVATVASFRKETISARDKERKNIEDLVAQMESDLATSFKDIEDYDPENDSPVQQASVGRNQQSFFDILRRNKEKARLNSSAQHYLFSGGWIWTDLKPKDEESLADLNISEDVRRQFREFDEKLSEGFEGLQCDLADTASEYKLCKRSSQLEEFYDDDVYLSDDEISDNGSDSIHSEDSGGEQCSFHSGTRSHDALLVNDKPWRATKIVTNRSREKIKGKDILPESTNPDHLSSILDNSYFTKRNVINDDSKSSTIEEKVMTTNESEGPSKLHVGELKKAFNAV